MNKKLILALVLAVIIAGGAFAQDDMWTSYAPGIDQSSFFINAGIGWGFNAYSSLKYSLPPVSISVDYALPIGLPITVGGYFGLALYDDKGDPTTYGGRYSGSQMGFGVRATYHVNFGVENLDVYAGLTLGWMIFTYQNEYNTNQVIKYDVSGFYYAGNVGIRYFFLDFLGVYLEVGYSPVSIASAGLTFKF